MRGGWLGLWLCCLPARVLVLGCGGFVKKTVVAGAGFPERAGFFAVRPRAPPLCVCALLLNACSFPVRSWFSRLNLKT